MYQLNFVCFFFSAMFVKIQQLSQQSVWMCGSKPEISFSNKRSINAMFKLKKNTVVQHRITKKKSLFSVALKKKSFEKNFFLLSFMKINPKTSIFKN